ncbi:MAG: hypothetical protein AAGA60_18520 [Cyanobacteria bacterium P01_E01_bin.42]
MKKKLFPIAIAITILAVTTSIYLATLDDPTDIQKNLSNTMNTIALGGAAAIFGLLDDEPENN